MKLDVRSWPILKDWPGRPSLLVDWSYSLIDINYERPGLRELIGLLLCAGIISAFGLGITGSFKTRKKLAVKVVCSLTGTSILLWIIGRIGFHFKLRSRGQSRRSYRRTLLSLWGN
jgi:hypothetical protein